MKRGVGSTTLCLALLMGVAACDDNPLSEGREDAAFFMLNPVNASLEAGDTTKVLAIVMNEYGTPTNAPVTAEPCDSKITATADPNRSAFESPETFLVVGQTLGVSCLVVRGGGLVDTAIVRVVPSRIEIVGDTLLQSGATANYTVRFLNVAGQPVTGFGLSAVTFSTGSSSIGAIGSDTGELSARAPGTTPVIATLRNTWGVARVDTLFIRVQPGVFTGTVAQSAGRGGQILTFTQGSIPFDADTKVSIVGAVDSVTYLERSGTTLIAAVPFGTAAGTRLNYNIVNLGPNQVAVAGSFTTTAANPTDTWGDNSTPGSASVFPAGQTVVVGTMGDTGSEEFLKVTITEAGTYRLQVDWNNGSDIDVYITDEAYTRAFLARETAANPEVGTATLQPGTYLIEMFMWEAAAPTTSYRVRFTKQ